MRGDDRRLANFRMNRRKRGMSSRAWQEGAGANWNLGCGPGSGAAGTGAPMAGVRVREESSGGRTRESFRGASCGGRLAAFDVAGLDAVAAVVFGAVESFVGGAEDEVGIGAGAETGVAEAGRDGEDQVADDDRFSGNLPANVFGQRSEFVKRAGGDQQELLSAVAADRVQGREGLFDPPGGGNEYGIADSVAVGVVDELEPIEIENDDTDRTTRGAGQFHAIGEELADVGAVFEAGESVVGGLLPELFAGVEEFVLQFDDAPASAETDAELLLIEGLDDIVVGTGIHSFNDILFLGAAGEEEDVGV